MRIFSKAKDLKILEQINSKSNVKRHIQFVIGCFLIAVSYNLFLAPNNIVAGGVGGLAIIINYLTLTGQYNEIYNEAMKDVKTVVETSFKQHTTYKPSYVRKNNNKKDDYDLSL